MRRCWSLLLLAVVSAFAGATGVSPVGATGISPGGSVGGVPSTLVNETLTGTTTNSGTISGGTVAPTTLTVPSGTTIPTATLTGTTTNSGTISGGTISSPTIVSGIFNTAAQFNANPSIANSAPVAVFSQSGAGANNGNWLLGASAGAMVFQAFNDASTVFQSYLAVSRTGTTITNVDFPQGTLTKAGVAIPTVSSSDTLTNKTLSGDTLSGTTTNSGTISGGTISSPTITGTVAGTPSASGVWSFSANGGPIRVVNNDGGVVQPTNITSFFGTNFSNGSAEADFFNGANRGSFPGGWEWYQWTGTATTYNRQMRLGGTGGLQLYNDGTAPTGGDCGGGCFNAIAARVQNDPVATLAAAQTLTNKSLTSPNITGTATMGGNPTLSGSFNVDNTVSSTKACASGFTRMSPNLCRRTDNVASPGTALTIGTCTSITLPASDAKTLLILGALSPAGQNVAGLIRTAQIDSFSNSGCTTNNAATLKLSAVEWIASSGGTLASMTTEFPVPVISGAVFLKLTAPAASGGFFEVRGYTD